MPLTDHQRFNHIPGEQYLNKKHFLADLLTQYAKREGTSHVMPETYRLDVEEQVINLAEMLQSFYPEIPFNNNQYNIPAASDKEQQDISLVFNEIYDTLPESGAIEWMYKPTDNLAHNGRGIFVLTTVQLCAYLLKDLRGRNACIQRYISNPMLLGGKKFDLRLYMLIGNIDPALVLFHSGIARRAVDDFDVASGDPSLNIHITNVQNVKDKRKEALALAKKNNLNISEAELNAINDKFKLTDYVLDMENLQAKLESQHSVPPNWVQSDLLPKVMCLIRDTFLAARPELSLRPRYYALMGVDVMIDSNRRPWLLEVQKSPSMDPGGKTGLPDSLVFKRALVIDLWKHHLNLISNLYREQRRRAEWIAKWKAIRLFAKKKGIITKHPQNISNPGASRSTAESDDSFSEDLNLVEQYCVKGKIDLENDELKSFVASHGYLNSGSGPHGCIFMRIALQLMAGKIESIAGYYDPNSDELFEGEHASMKLMCKNWTDVSNLKGSYQVVLDEFSGFDVGPLTLHTN